MTTRWIHKGMKHRSKKGTLLCVQPWKRKEANKQGMGTIIRNNKIRITSKINKKRKKKKKNFFFFSLRKNGKRNTDRQMVMDSPEESTKGKGLGYSEEDLT